MELNSAGVRRHADNSTFPVAWSYTAEHVTANDWKRLVPYLALRNFGGLVSKRFVNLFD